MVESDHASPRSHHMNGDRMGVSLTFHLRDGIGVVTILGEYSRLAIPYPESHPRRSKTED